jgi:hypothetical protein
VREIPDARVVVALSKLPVELTGCELRDPLGAASTPPNPAALVFAGAGLPGSFGMICENPADFTAGVVLAEIGAGLLGSF